MIRGIIKSAYERVAGVYQGASRTLLDPVLKRGNLLPIVYVIILVALSGGFVDAVAYPVPNQGVLVYPSAAAQTVSEAILFAFVILLGGAGIYVTFISGRQTTKARAVNMYLLLALLLIFVSALAGIELLILKGI